VTIQMAPSVGGPLQMRRGDAVRVRPSDRADQPGGGTEIVAELSGRVKIRFTTPWD
jgi:hypothetical protein